METAGKPFCLLLGDLGAQCPGPEKGHFWQGYRVQGIGV